MYNEELKTRFIAEYAGGLLTTGRLADMLFRRLGKYENVWQADVCTRTVEQLQPAIDEIAAVRGRDRWVYATILAEYAKWCMAMGVPGACDGLMHVSVDAAGENAMRHQTVSSPEHLQRVLDDIMDPESEETVDLIYRGFCWLTYGGMPHECIYTATAQDVDFARMQVRYRLPSIEDDTVEIERFARLYRESLVSIGAAATLSSFIYRHPLYEPSRRERYPGDELLRGFKAPPGANTLDVLINRRNASALKEGRTDVRISYQRLRLSGVFYRTYEIERKTGQILFEDEISSTLIRLDSTNENGSGSASSQKYIKTRQAQIRNSYYDDYLMWKKVFSL